MTVNFGTDMIGNTIVTILELVFKQYKNDQCLDQTNVQGDFSLMGSEFINFISTVLTCRLIQKARIAGLLNKMSY